MNAPASIPVSRNRIAPGVYFGLSDALYHADPALGSGSIRNLAKCAMYYWQDSWMNPQRPADTEAAALVIGRALHKIILEGSEAFAHAFRKEPLLADHPNALDTIPQIKAALKSLGQKLTGDKAELVERLRIADPDAVFWDDILTAFRRECAEAEATALKADVYEGIKAAGWLVASNERVAPAFQGGRAEISVFWEDDGVPLKCRLDYTRLGIENGRGVGLITDLKSFANKNDVAPERAVLNCITTFRLDIQAAQYLEGAARMSEFIREGQVFGAEDVNADWLNAIANLGTDDWRWFWCFYEKDAPVTLLRSTRPGSDLIEAAGIDFSRALQTYRDNIERFGVEWRFVDRTPGTEITLADMPKWFGAEA